MTRIATVELETNSGLLRESLSSLHSLFSTTRQILRSYGPQVSRPKNPGNLSLGDIAISVLNDVLRPFLSKWHPLLLHHEKTKAIDITPIDHERQWEMYSEFHQVFLGNNLILREYADLLAKVSGITSITNYDV